MHIYNISYAQKFPVVLHNLNVSINTNSVKLQPKFMNKSPVSTALYGLIIHKYI